jgi:hypothetical protein
MRKAVKIVAILLCAFVVIVAIAHAFNLHGVLGKLHGDAESHFP